MSEKILIASDSTTDLSPELIEKYGIKILPMGVTVGDRDYTDGVDINPDMIYENYNKTGQLPKTAAINIAQFADFFEEHTAEGYSIVLFTISAEMSSTLSNARLAAEDFENVYVVNTSRFEVNTWDAVNNKDINVQDNYHWSTEHMFGVGELVGRCIIDEILKVK